MTHPDLVPPAEAGPCASTPAIAVNIDIDAQLVAATVAEAA